MRDHSAWRPGSKLYYALVAAPALIFLSVPKVYFMSGSYFPASIFPIVLGFFSAILFLRKSSGIKKESVVLLAIFIYLNIITIVFYLFSGKSGGGLSELAPLYVGLIMFVVMSYIYSVYPAHKIYKTMKFGAKIALIYGVFEIFCYVGLIPTALKALVSEFTSGRFTSRVQLFTPEASWASTFLITIAPLFYSKELKQGSDLFYKVLIVTLMLATFSLQGFMSLFFAFVLYYYFGGKNIASERLISTFKLVFGAVAGMMALYFFVLLLPKENVPYFITRFMRLISADGLSLGYIISIDDSIFIRIMYPIYAFIIGMQNIFGVGVANYGMVFNEAFSGMPYSGLAVGNTEVVNDILTETADPKNIYTGIFAHGGLFCLLMLFIFLRMMFRRVSELKDSSFFQVATFQYFVALATLLQFGTYAYFPLWLAVAAILNMGKYEKISAKYEKN